MSFALNSNWNVGMSWIFLCLSHSLNTKSEFCDVRKSLDNRQNVGGSVYMRETTMNIAILRALPIVVQHYTTTRLTFDWVTYCATLLCSCCRCSYRCWLIARKLYELFVWIIRYAPKGTNLSIFRVLISQAV